MRDAVLAGDENHRRGTGFASRTRVVSSTTIDVDRLLLAIVGLDSVAYACDAVRMKRDSGAIKRLDPLHLAALFALLGRNLASCDANLFTKRSQLVRRRVSHVKREEDMAWARVDAARG